MYDPLIVDAFIAVHSELSPAQLDANAHVYGIGRCVVGIKNSISLLDDFKSCNRNIGPIA